MEMSNSQLVYKGLNFKGEVVVGNVNVNHPGGD